MTTLNSDACTERQKVDALNRLIIAIEDSCKRHKVPCKECESCTIKSVCTRLNKSK